jgi:hypothetical protein
MNSKRRQQQQEGQQPNQNQCHSDYEDDESQNKSDLCI